MEKQQYIEEMRKKFAHIKGWGIDADPENEPTYPMKHYTGDDHKRLNWERPPLQEKNSEILQSTEHLRTPAVFSTIMPPQGLSGVIRRHAFKYSENMLRHWLLLIFADRVNVVEGLIEDAARVTVPDIVKERGFDAMWEHDKKLLLQRTVIRAAFYAAAIGIVATMLAGDKKENAEAKKSLRRDPELA